MGMMVTEYKLDIVELVVMNKHNFQQEYQLDSGFVDQDNIG